MAFSIPSFFSCWFLAGFAVLSFFWLPRFAVVLFVCLVRIILYSRRLTAGLSHDAPDFEPGAGVHNGPFQYAAPEVKLSQADRRRFRKERTTVCWLATVFEQFCVMI